MVMMMMMIVTSLVVRCWWWYVGLGWGVKEGIRSMMIDGEEENYDYHL